MIMQNSVALAERINKEIEGWCSTATDIEKARLVVNWCDANKMNLTATPTQLHLAMLQMPYWNQGPSDYMSMAQALTAAGINTAIDNGHCECPNCNEVFCRKGDGSIDAFIGA